MDGGIPKIPLDSAGDLQFLRQQLHDALSRRLALHLPQAVAGDPLRRRIDALIQSFLSDTMRQACKNVLINGLDPRPSDLAKGVQASPVEVFENFDIALQYAVQAKYADVERAVTQLTTLRREVPSQIAARYRAKHGLPAAGAMERGTKRAHGEVDDADAGEDASANAATAARADVGTSTGQSSLPSPPAEEDDSLQLSNATAAGGATAAAPDSVGACSSAIAPASATATEAQVEDDSLDVKIARLGEIIKTYERSVGQLGALGREVGGVTAKVERARDVLDHIERAQKRRATAATTAAAVAAPSAS